MIEAWAESGWPVARLGEIAEVGAGGPAPQGAEYYAEGSHPFVRMQDVGRCKGMYLGFTADRLNQFALAQHRLRLWPRNSVLIPKSGASVALNNRALLREPSFVVSHLAVVVPGKLVHPAFLYFFSTLVDMTRYSLDPSYPSLKVSDISDINVPIPPFSEQLRIVEILNEEEELSALRRVAAARFRDLIPSIFHARFSARNRGSQVALENVAQIVSGVALGRKIRGGRLREIPYLRVANVQAGDLDLDDIKTTIASEREIDAFALKPGDVLVTEGGDHDKLGRGCLWSGEVEPCIHQNHVFRVRPDPSQLRSRFLAEYLQSAEAKHYFFRCAKRTTNLASINLTQLKALAVPVVSLEEQERFEEEVKMATALSSDRADTLFRELRQSLMIRAFSGVLTRGWREQNAEAVREESAERDRILSTSVHAEAGAFAQHMQSISEAHTQVSMGAVTTVSYADLRDRLYLTNDQRQVLRALESLAQEEATESGQQLAMQQNATDIARAVRGNLRNDVQAVEGCLKVLDSLGLIVTASRPQRDPATDATMFGTCYRLPEQGGEPESEEAKAGTRAQDRRGEAMAVLMAARERT